MKNNIKGFSLIELSIVLIIIGLLVAGITGGASLIRSAELRSVMTESRSYKTSINAYYTSQDDLPGDGDGTATYGDGNGRIEAYNADDEAEGVLAWQDMIDEGIMDLADMTDINALTANTLDAITIEDGGMPASKYKGAGWTFDYDTTENSNILILTRDLYELTVVGGAAANLTPTVILTGDKAISVDKKLDDGDLDTGSVFGMDAYATGASSEPGSAQTCAAGTSEVCALAFKIGL